MATKDRSRGSSKNSTTASENGGNRKRSRTKKNNPATKSSKVGTKTVSKVVDTNATDMYCVTCKKKTRTQNYRVAFVKGKKGGTGICPFCGRKKSTYVS